MPLQFSAWPPGSVDRFRRIAIELARSDGELGQRHIATLIDFARRTDLSGFDDATVARFIDVVVETPELEAVRGERDSVAQEHHIFPPPMSWIARGVVRSCDDDGAIINVSDAAPDGMWRGNTVSVGAEARAHAPIAAGDEVYLATEAEGGTGPTFRVVRTSSDLVVLSLALVRPNRPPLRLSFLANQGITGRIVFEDHDPAVGGMWGMRCGAIGFMTNADFNSYDLNECDDPGLVVATTTDVVTGTEEEALAIRLPTTPFNYSPVGTWVKVTSLGNIFFTALSQDGELNEHHAFECGDESVWAGTWQSGPSAGCQLSTGPFQTRLSWSGIGSFLAGHETWPDGTDHGVELYRVE